MARRRITAAERLLRNEQPISWGRTIVCGALASALMMAFIDCFYMMQLTDFSFEYYIGSMILWDTNDPRIWLTGFLANLGIGAIFGLIYAYIFEYWLKRATPRDGVLLGMAHFLAAGLTILPFMAIVHSSDGFPVPRYDATTVMLLLVGHTLFGATMGTLYGPVRMDRVHAYYGEPGEVGYPGERGVITPDMDPEERTEPSYRASA